MKIEKVILCPLSALQSTLHTRLINEAISRAVGPPIGSASSDGVGSTGRSEVDRLLADEAERSQTNAGSIIGSSLNFLMQLRKVCNHPYLILESMKCIPDELYFNHLVETSGKMQLLAAVLDKLIPEGHKVCMDCVVKCTPLIILMFCFVLFYYNCVRFYSSHNLPQCLIFYTDSFKQEDMGVID